jgi:hypothetical protein
LIQGDGWGRLLEWTRTTRRRITVRLVKGACWDYETVINRQKGWPVPVFQSKEETDLNFEELTTLLLENAEFLRPAIATHNIRSVSNAIAVADSLNLPRDSFEFQMLYGMGEPVRQVLRKRGYRVRVYAAVGELIPGMAYLVRRLLENTSNESFVKQFFAEKRTFEELIRPPERNRATSEQSPLRETFRNEPALDFSRAEHRQKMRDALKKDLFFLSSPAAFPLPYPRGWCQRESSRAAGNEGNVIRARNAEGGGYFIGPVMVLDAEPHSPVAQDEIFGPLLAVMRAGDFGEAVDLVNSTPYALTGGIFSRSPVHIMKAKEEFRVGNLYINRKITGALVGRQPFGGFGMSGVGSKAGGPDYLLQFMNPRTVSENILRKGFSHPVISSVKEKVR